MALTITATPDPYTFVVRLLVAGGVPAYTVTAQPSGGQAAYVVSSPQTPVTGDATARNMIDGRVPLGAVSTAYTVTDAAGVSASTAAAVTIAATMPVLSDALDPNKLIQLPVVSQRPNHWEARSVYYPVLGRRDPTVAIAPMALRDGELVLSTDGTPVARRAVINLLSSGDPLILRTPCPSAVDDVTLLVTSAAEELLNDSNPVGLSNFRLTYQAVTSDLGPFTGDPSRTYDTVKTAWPSYADLPPAYATYGDLLSGSAYANQGAQLVGAGWDTPSNVAAWNTFWTSGTYTFTCPAGVGLVSNTGAGVLLFVAVHQPTIWNMATAAGKRYRLSFRARVASGALGAGARVHMLTNTMPATADYFVAGQVTAASALLTLTAGWQTLTFDATVPAGDDVASFFFRVENQPAGSTVEISTPSVRELT